MIALLVLLGVVVFIILALIAIYNKLVKQRQMVQEGWSGIDVQLKRRSNLIPNLVETVRGYMGHEDQLLTRVTQLRGQLREQKMPMSEKGRMEGDLGGLLTRLLAVAEAYPDLKANQNFLGLQDQLANIEDQIQMARRYYNGSVRNYNTSLETFPNNLVAGFFRFMGAEYFELQDASDREVPEVDFKKATA